MLVAWAEDYLDEATAQSLTRLASEVQGSAELLTVANDALKQDLPPRMRVALCLRCATWYSDHLGRPDSAIACYEQALAIDPGHLLRRCAWPASTKRPNSGMLYLPCSSVQCS